MARLSFGGLPETVVILLAAGSALAEPARGQAADSLLLPSFAAHDLPAPDLPARVKLVWRDDPRPAAEFPAGADPAQDWRLSRRALRRAARRGIQLEGIQPEVAPPSVVGPRAGPAVERATGSSTSPPGSRTVARPLPPRLVPIPVETTLTSPFASTAMSPASLVHRGQSYGDDARQRFDIFLPPECAGGGLPLVVWIPGSDWRSATPADCPLEWLVDRGYVVASIGYRTTDTVVFPAPLDDCRAAVAVLQRDAELWGIDPERVCVVGTAAGGHLAALVAYAEPAADVAAVCSIAAPTHLPSLGASHERVTSPVGRLIGGPLAELREAALAASPLVHVSADDPPTLLIHGHDDAMIPVDQTLRLEKALAAAGVDVTLRIHDGGATPPLGPNTVAGRQLLEFLDRILGPGRPVAP
jgi:acetyl esterase/lipase